MGFIFTPRFCGYFHTTDFIGIYCKSCKQEVPWNHRCYIKPIESQQDRFERLEQNQVDGVAVDEEIVREQEMFLDEPAELQHMTSEIRSSTRTEIEEFNATRYCYFDIEAYADDKNQFTHHANLLVAQINQPNEHQMIFSGDDAIDQFMRWAICEARAGTTFIAHNFKVCKILNSFYKSSLVHSARPYACL